MRFRTTEGTTGRNLPLTSSNLRPEIFARQGDLKGGQQKKVAIDTLKLITIRRERSEAKLHIAFADQEASLYATGGGWVAQALRTWKVEVVVIDIPPELRDEIRAAQEGQRMVNPDERATLPSTTRLWRDRACP
jgi:hypothetical protein